MTTDEIIDVLTMFDPHFPRQALSEAPEHKEGLIPRLLDALDYIADNVEWLMEEEPDYYLHVYAMYLLAQFREQRAFPKLVRLLWADNDTLDFYMGDILTEDYKKILCSTYNGDIGLLRDVIENKSYDEYARNTAMQAYAYIVRDGHLSRREMTDYVRGLVNNCLENDDTELANTVIDVIINEHIFELIPDAQKLYDEDMVDSFVSGTYDNFINFIFDYRYPDMEIYIDDTVAELQHWACYKTKPKPSPRTAPVPTQAAEKPQKKIGRNDPCPCGSGKKYKKCCLNKGNEIATVPQINPDTLQAAERPLLSKFFPKYSLSEPNVVKKPAAPSLRDLFDTDKPYNLLTGYPSLKPTGKTGERLLTEFFSPIAIEIDIPVYKALYHRAIPIWVDRDEEQEDMERIDLLLDAFARFTRVCADEGIKSFDAFDEKYMVHYSASVWVSHLFELLEEYQDAICKDRRGMLESVSETLKRMDPGGA
jgi:hypothetical protein